MRNRKTFKPLKMKLLERQNMFSTPFTWMLTVTYEMVSSDHAGI